MQGRQQANAPCWIDWIALQKVIRSLFDKQIYKIAVYLLLSIMPRPKSYLMVDTKLMVMILVTSTRF